MLSIQFIRDNPEVVRNSLLRRGEEPQLALLLEKDARRREFIQYGDRLRARRNEVSRQLGKTENRPPEILKEMRAIGEQVKEFGDQVKNLDEQIHGILLTLPNLPSKDVPDGLTEADNTIVRSWGHPRTYDFAVQPHWDIGTKLDIIDLERGAKLSGSRFFILKGDGARLQRALISWMLDVHVKEHGYTEIYPPYLVRRAMLEGAGQLPKFADNLYRDDEDDLWLNPTAEVPLTNLHREEILEPGSLPLYYTAHAPSFRREKAAAGRDTRGIKRVHQFEKVELYKYVEPHTSDIELGKLLSDAESLCQKLDLPYRVVSLCAGDMAFQSSKSFDIEVWSPGCEEWLEVSSCSNCTDFQARRSNIRYRAEPGGKPQFPHTLNGSGLALPRIIIALLETYQTNEGHIEIPAVLRPWMGQNTIPKLVDS